MNYLEYFYQINIPSQKADEILRVLGLIDSDTSVFDMVEEKGNWNDIAKELEANVIVPEDLLGCLASKLSKGLYLGSWNKNSDRLVKETLSSKVDNSFILIVTEDNAFLINTPKIGMNSAEQF